MTKANISKLSEILNCLEAQFDEPDERGVTRVDYVDSDKNFIYIEVEFADEEVEEMKLRMDEFNSKKSFDEIAKTIW